MAEPYLPEPVTGDAPVDSDSRDRPQAGRD